MNVSKMCHVCKIYEETVEHVLFHCNHARVIWFAYSLGVISHIGSRIMV